MEDIWLVYPLMMQDLGLMDQCMQGVKGATGNTTYMSGSQLTSGTFQFTGDFSYYTAS